VTARSERADIHAGRRAARKERAPVAPAPAVIAPIMHWIHMTSRLWHAGGRAGPSPVYDGRMGRRPNRVRISALLLAAVYAIHQVRMAIEGGDAGGVAGSAAHLYLPLLAGSVAALVLLAAGQFALSLGRARRRAPVQAGSRTSSFGRDWALVSALLVAAHVAQQLAEGAAGGHLEALAGAGLAVAVAAAAVAGALVAALLLGADRALAAIAGRGSALTRRRPGRGRWRAVDVARTGPAPLACHLACRPPPLAA
jgi:hypothetical protein